MNSNLDPSVDRLVIAIQDTLGSFAVVILVIWIVIAGVAGYVAPQDRRTHFFWCTLVLFGPIGVALALVAPARPPE